MPDNIGVSNAIGGALKNGDLYAGDNVGEWSFEYNQVERSVYLKIQLANGNAIVIGSCQSIAGCKLEKTDVNQIAQWLYAVKCNMG